jgi:hypothetical protein
MKSTHSSLAAFSASSHGGSSNSRILQDVKSVDDLSDIALTSPADVLVLLRKSLDLKNENFAASALNLIVSYLNPLSLVSNSDPTISPSIVSIAAAIGNGGGIGYIDSLLHLRITSPVVVLPGLQVLCWLVQSNENASNRLKFVNSSYCYRIVKVCARL